MITWPWWGRGERAPAREDGDAIRKIARELEALPEERARFVALFAFLLARVANVDALISDVETREMQRLLERWGSLPASQAALVVEVAKTQSRLFGSTQNFLAAREFRDLATEDEKRALLHCMFAVCAADDEITIPEEETVREVAKELLLSGDEYLAARSEYREKRTVLKGWPPRPP